MSSNQPIEAWQNDDSLNTYHLWLKMMREKGLRAGKFEPVNDEERLIVVQAKAGIT